MATITACTSASSVTQVGLVHKTPVPRTCSTVLGLPVMPKVGKVKCSMKGNPGAQEASSKVGMGASLIAAASAAAMSSPAAMALVDERLSTEGTGLPFGLSNNLLGWILFGMFGLIWSLYFVYTSGLDEDEESGLSL
ncbi:Photosystem II reaction center W protein, chloroplastic [Heracleum sosnowskyi]|uniref:PSII 6.1 kDa protein n=1 Tax=Heracleum sosnowskyi TaxID=360622 RepID=A0AAD8N7X8_9APIA|nr:Photosystem II reaction center W protein, chloroplastic [Heracleum sosnowskyi]